jgi:hypothetical protein
MKSRRMRWAGHVTRMEEMKNTYSTVVGKGEGKRHLEDLEVDGGIILNWILKK